MSDITDTHNRVLRMLQANGTLPSVVPEDSLIDITDYVGQSLRYRFLELLPGINVGSKDGSDDLVRRAVRKVNEVAEEGSIKDVLDTAAAETIDAIKSRPAWKRAGGLAAPAEKAKPGMHLINALNGAVETLFAEGIMWSQCCEPGNKAPFLFHYMQAAVAMRLLNRIPGFDTGNDIAEYDRQIVYQIHEFNEAPGVTDVKRILDAAMDKAFADLRLEKLQDMTVFSKPLRLSGKTPGP